VRHVRFLVRKGATGYFFGGLECWLPFASVAHFVFLRDVWIRSCRSKQTCYQLSHPSHQPSHPSHQLSFPSHQPSHPSHQLSHPSPNLATYLIKLRHPSFQLSHPSLQLSHPSYLKYLKNVLFSREFFSNSSKNVAKMSTSNHQVFTKMWRLNVRQICRKSFFVPTLSHINTDVLYFCSFVCN
jgi:hypothetical protein